MWIEGVRECVESASVCEEREKVKLGSVDRTGETSFDDAAELHLLSLSAHLRTLHTQSHTVYPHTLSTHLRTLHTQSHTVYPHTLSTHTPSHSHTHTHSLTLTHSGPGPGAGRRLG